MIFEFKKPDPEFMKQFIEKYKAEKERRKQRPSDDVLARVLGWVRDHGAIFSEDVDYMVQSYNFTGDEFYAVDSWLDNLAEEMGVVKDNSGDGDSMFPETFGSFAWGDMRFVYHTMSGQGTVSTLVRADYNPENIPFDEDCFHTIPA